MANMKAAYLLAGALAAGGAAGAAAAQPGITYTVGDAVKIGADGPAVDVTGVTSTGKKTSEEVSCLHAGVARDVLKVNWLGNMFHGMARASVEQEYPKLKGRALADTVLRVEDGVLTAMDQVKAVCTLNGAPTRSAETDKLLDGLRLTK